MYEYQVSISEHLYRHLSHSILMRQKLMRNECNIWLKHYTIRQWEAFLFHFCSTYLPLCFNPDTHRTQPCIQSNQYRRSKIFDSSITKKQSEQRHLLFPLHFHHHASIQKLTKLALYQNEIDAEGARYLASALLNRHVPMADTHWTQSFHEPNRYRRSTIFDSSNTT